MGSGKSSNCKLTPHKNKTFASQKYVPPLPPTVLPETSTHGFVCYEPASLLYAKNVLHVCVNTHSAPRVGCCGTRLKTPTCLPLTFLRRLLQIRRR